MNDHTIPPVLYYGTSSLYLAGILNSGINPNDSFGGKLLLTADINQAVRDATAKTFYDEKDSQFKPDPNYRIMPIVCRVRSADLIESYIADGGEGRASNDNSNYVVYNDVIPVTKENIEVIAS